MEELVKKFLKENDCLYLKQHFKNAKQSPFMLGVMLTNSEGKTVTVNKQLFTDGVINVTSSDLTINESYLYNRDKKKFEVTKGKHSFFSL